MTALSWGSINGPKKDEGSLAFQLARESEKRYKMKRFLVFSGQRYYPSGGMSDFVGSYDTKEEAFTVAKEKIKVDDWTDVVDSELVSEDSYGFIKEKS